MLRSPAVAVRCAAMPVLRRDYRQLFDSGELTRVFDEVKGIVPVWDFSAPDWVPDRPELWTDSKHFVPDVSRMMIARIYGS